MRRWLTVCLLVGACRPIPYPPTPEADAAPSDAGNVEASTCARAWQHIQALGCTPTAPRSGTWTEACQNAEENAIDMHTDCVAAALNCVDVRICLGER